MDKNEDKYEIFADFLPIIFTILGIIIILILYHFYD